MENIILSAKFGQLITDLDHNIWAGFFTALIVAVLTTIIFNLFLKIRDEKKQKRRDAIETAAEVSVSLSEVLTCLNWKIRYSNISDDQIDSAVRNAQKFRGKYKLQIQKKELKLGDFHSNYKEILDELDKIRLSILENGNTPKPNMKTAKEYIQRLITKWQLENKDDLDVPEKEKTNNITNDYYLKWHRVITCKSNELSNSLLNNPRIYEKVLNFCKQRLSRCRQTKAMGHFKIGNSVPFGNYSWHVLEVQNGRVLLLCDNVIENRRYHHTEENTTWAECELRSYLNEEFIEKFRPKDRKRIVETKIATNTNPWFGADGGEIVNDKIFLLSIEEVVIYFGDNGDLISRKSWYWDNIESRVKEGDGGYLNDQYNNERIAKNTVGTVSWWWLRSPGDSNLRVARVRDCGIVCVHGSVTRGLTGKGGVRPALWLNL